MGPPCLPRPGRTCQSQRRARAQGPQTPRMSTSFRPQWATMGPHTEPRPPTPAPGPRPNVFPASECKAETSAAEHHQKIRPSTEVAKRAALSRSPAAARAMMITSGRCLKYERCRAGRFCKSEGATGAKSHRTGEKRAQWPGPWIRIALLLFCGYPSAYETLGIPHTRQEQHRCEGG